jgi:DNA-binding MarR family transcriptional regulator
MAKRIDDQRPPLGFLLVRIAEAVDRLFVAALADLSLKPRQLRLLVLVDRSPGLTQRELAVQLGMDAGNLIDVLDALETRGLLRRERDPADRRQRLVSLTAEGEALLRQATEATERVEDRLFAHLSTDERANFYDTALASYQHISGKGP